jgi:YVTN family beta-propeller protein
VFTPTDQPAFDTTKGDRFFQVVDTRTNQVTKRLVLGEVLEASGFGDRGLDSSVRPMAIAPGEKTVYLQLSFHHGFVELDLETDRVTRIADLPLSEEAKALPREEYPLDSAHHGLAINPEGTKLCAAGTTSGYAAIVDRDTFEPTLVDVGSKPYWSTNSADGTQCYVSVSGDDRVVVIDYATEKEVARFDVGNHPQRVRNGVIRNDIVAAAAPGAGAPPAGGPAAAPVPAAVPAPAGRSGSRSLAATGSELALPAALVLLTAGGAVALARRRTARG